MITTSVAEGHNSPVHTSTHCQRGQSRPASGASLLELCLERLLVLRSSWKAFWKPAACCVAPSEALMLEMKELIFLLVSLVAGDSRLL